MSKPEQPDAPGDSGGVFSNLPASRPGTRSPRRDRGKPGSAEGRARPARPKSAASPGDAPKPKPAPETKAAPRPAAKPKAQPGPQSREPETETEDGGHGGIEDLAWAGIAAAAEAATLGVRLASRAMGAVRDSVDRR